MAIIPKQIGWSQESNLLWNISSQLDRLTKVIANLSPGGGGTNIYNSDGTLTGNRTLIANNFQLTFQDINILEINGPLLNNGRTFVIDNTNKTYQIGDIDGSLNRTFLEISDINPYIKTSYGGNDIGLKLYFANSVYQFGQITGGNTTYLEIDDNLQVFRFYNNGVSNGLYLSFSNDVYFLGAISGTPFAGAQFRVNNNDPYPLQLEGTGIINASAGGASGQHLRIKINGTDYKIALLNP